MSARKIAGVGLISAPFWLILGVGLIVDTRDAAIGFGAAFVLVAVMALGFWLLEARP